jgi:dual oxidase
LSSGNYLGQSPPPFVSSFLRFLPGQFTKVYCSDLKWFEWHSFSISSSPEDDELVIFIEPDGHWTKRLHEKIKDRSAVLPPGNAAFEMQKRLTGTVGSIGLAWQSDRYTDFVLVAGGIGATPVMSMYRHLAAQRLRGRNLRLVHLVWACRSRQTIETLLQLEPADSSGPWISDESTIGDDTRNLSAFAADMYVTSAHSGVQIQEDSEEALTLSASSRGRDMTVRSTVLWHFGRPDLRAVMTAARAGAEARGVRRVAVFGCGPSHVTGTVCKESAWVSGGRIAFDAHLEHFV